MGNVYEYLIDGVSGLAPSSMEGAAMAVGVCSKGAAGDCWLLGPRSDVIDTLGSGSLTDLVSDMLAAGGQNCKVIAVKVVPDGDAPTTGEILAAVSSALERYEVEFVAVAGVSDNTAWQAYQTKAEAMWNLHRPIYFKCAARLPNENESLDSWATALTTMRAGIAARFVQVCAQFGVITDSSGNSATRNWLGLQAGRTLSNPVQRAAGRVKDGPISQGSLPDGWNDAIQSTLESAGFLTAKVYPGLDGCYWGDSRTLAEATSDYQYEEVVRVVFKAMRLARMAALNSMYDELGDPALEDNPAGLAMLQANIENNLNTMVNAIPKEMAGFKVEIPAGQDFVNNGVALEMTLIGIPIIREIKLYGKFVYAGSVQDPRME